MSIVNQVLTIKSVPNCDDNFVFKNAFVNTVIESAFNYSMSIRVRHCDCNCDTKPITDWHEDIFNMTTSTSNSVIAELEVSYNDGSIHTTYLKLFPTHVDDIFIEFNAKISDFIKITKKPNPNISWDEYFMSLAVLTSYRSKDENTKVGSVLVSNDNKILGTGYNGLPTSIDESLFPKSREGNLHETKYAYTIHAEANCLLNTTVFDISNSRMYVTLFPCNECAKLLIQKKVSEVIYLSDKYHDESSYIASRKMFDAMGIITRKYEGDLKLINKQQ